MEQTANQTVLCVECAGELEVKPRTLAGEVIPCPECGAEMEVISLVPLRIELAPPVKEDWGE